MPRCELGAVDRAPDVRPGRGGGCIPARGPPRLPASTRRRRGGLAGDNRHVITAAGGTYALLLYCGAERRVRIGRLGRLELKRGWYVYVGSAFGAGGLRARIEHHRRVALRPHWHIDYLRRWARVVGVRTAAGVRCEHEWAEIIGRMQGAETPLRGFGSSDCGCEAHLFRFGERPAGWGGAGGAHRYSEGNFQGWR